MADRAHNIMLISNEIAILFSSYLIMIFSDYVPTVEDRYNFGYLYLAVFFLETLVNVLMLIAITI